MIPIFLLINLSYKINGYFTMRYQKEFYLHGAEINFQFTLGEDYDRLIIFFTDTLLFPPQFSFLASLWR
uniref:Uncharacterized protein n=1 Tax=candidate division WOR-3 bacterium TaxID=2052148 RepID=A0A7V3ZV76_UNCW3